MYDSAVETTTTVIIKTKDAIYKNPKLLKKFRQLKICKKHPNGLNRGSLNT